MFGLVVGSNTHYWRMFDSMFDFLYDSMLDVLHGVCFVFDCDIWLMVGVLCVSGLTSGLMLSVS